MSDRYFFTSAIHTDNIGIKRKTMIKVFCQLQQVLVYMYMYMYVAGGKYLNVFNILLHCKYILQLWRILNKSKRDQL